MVVRVPIVLLSRYGFVLAFALLVAAMALPLIAAQPQLPAQNPTVCPTCGASAVVGCGCQSQPAIQMAVCYVPVWETEYRTEWRTQCRLETRYQLVTEYDCVPRQTPVTQHVVTMVPEERSRDVVVEQVVPLRQPFLHTEAVPVTYNRIRNELVYRKVAKVIQEEREYTVHEAEERTRNVVQYRMEKRTEIMPTVAWV